MVCYFSALLDDKPIGNRQLAIGNKNMIVNPTCFIFTPSVDAH
jgi:hypothetical protein